MCEVCTDNREILVSKYYDLLREKTNIETSYEEMMVVRNILFRFWQLGWLDKLEADAVPVVRCRECIHRDPEDHKCDSGQLERAGCVFPVDDDYFCKYGQRREDGDA